MENRALIMEQPGSVQCPIASIESYLSHLNPNCTALFQKLKREFNPSLKKSGTIPLHSERTPLQTFLKLFQNELNVVKSTQITASNTPKQML